MSKPTSTPALQAAQQRTLDRLAAIHHQFASNPGSGRFAGKVAIVTGVGSTKGIGRASTIALAREGAKHLYVMDFAASTLASFAKELEKKYSGLKVTAIEADAADEKAIASVCDQAVREEGRLDFFYANAGITGQNFNMATTDPDEFMEIYRVNTLSCFLAVKHASEAMKAVGGGKKAEAGGSILLTASVAGMRSGAGPIAYSGSKAAVINLANTAAQNLAGTNIRVNAVLPGLVETGMTTYTFERAKERGTLGKVGQLNPLKRFGIAEEIANAVLFLASDESSYINGIALPVDGGLSSSHPVVPGQAH